MFCTSSRVCFCLSTVYFLAPSVLLHHFWEEKMFPKIHEPKWIYFEIV